MTDENNGVTTVRSGTEVVLDISSFISSAVPWIGGPVSNVLSGISFGRKISRVKEVLEGIANDLRNFKSEVSETYVKTEEFEELLENTLRNVAEERNEERRRIYKAFIVGTIKSPGQSYDEQVRFLRILEDIQGDHIRILEALSQSPDMSLLRHGLSGSPI